MISQSLECRKMVGELGHRMAHSSTSMLNSIKNLQKCLNRCRGVPIGVMKATELYTLKVLIFMLCEFYLNKKRTWTIAVTIVDSILNVCCQFEYN